MKISIFYLLLVSFYFVSCNTNNKASTEEPQKGSDTIFSVFSDTSYQMEVSCCKGSINGWKQMKQYTYQTNGFKFQYKDESTGFDSSIYFNFDLTRLKRPHILGFGYVLVLEKKVTKQKKGFIETLSWELRSYEVLDYGKALALLDKLSTQHILNMDDSIKNIRIRDYAGFGEDLQLLSYARADADYYEVYQSDLIEKIYQQKKVISNIDYNTSLIFMQRKIPYSMVFSLERIGDINEDSPNLSKEEAKKEAERLLKEIKDSFTRMDSLQSQFIQKMGTYHPINDVKESKSAEWIQYRDSLYKLLKENILTPTH